MELVSKLKDMVPWKRKPIESHEVVSLRNDINRVFDRLFALFGPDWLSGRGAWPRGASSVGFDLEGTNDEMIVRAKVPGINPNDLDVTLRDGVLQVRYEYEENERNGGSIKRSYGSLVRTVALPDGLNLDKAKAKCRHGLLTVRIPWHAEARSRTRRIPIDT